MYNNKESLEKKWIIRAIPILFIVGSFMHFLYEWTGNNAIVGLIAPINESIWEHMKLAMLPVILFWIIYYALMGTENKINKNKWFTGALLSLIISVALIPFLYYFYTGAFGVELLLVDVLILLISVTAGQLAAYHFYGYKDGINYIVAIMIMLIVVYIFMYFTFNTPDFPIFIS